MKRADNLLICVIKRRSDLTELIEEKRYRLPIKQIPVIDFDYMAFYQPKRVFSDGKCIKYYAKISGKRVGKRAEESQMRFSKSDPEEPYHILNFKRIIKLPVPIVNSSGMRVSFKRGKKVKLISSKTLSELFNVFPLENIMRDLLAANRIEFKREFVVIASECRKYRLDFAIICSNGKIDLECDSKKWHNIKMQKIKDLERDEILSNLGWTVLRFTESSILERQSETMRIIKNAVEKCREISKHGRTDE